MSEKSNIVSIFGRTETTNSKGAQKLHSANELGKGLSSKLPASMNPKYAHLFIAGKRFFEQKNYLAAIDCAHRIIEHDGSSFPANNILGSSHLALANLECDNDKKKIYLSNALEALNRGYLSAPAVVFSLRLDFGYTYYLLGKYSQAIKIYEEVWNIRTTLEKHQLIELVIRLYILYSEMNDQLSDLYRQHLLILSNDINGFSIMCEVLFNLGKVDSALICINNIPTAFNSDITINLIKAKAFLLKQDYLQADSILDNLASTNKLKKNKDKYKLWLQYKIEIMENLGNLKKKNKYLGILNSIVGKNTAHNVKKLLEY